MDKTTDYVGGMVYEDGTLIQVSTSEGRLVPNGSAYEYEYYLKDHLGNTRVVFGINNGVAELRQSNNYYPFGLSYNQKTYASSHSPYQQNKYLYNGKEIQNDGFGGVNLDWYDYGARFYDPALARFSTVDPLAEEYYFQNPYAYAANSPIRYIDWMGMGPGDYVMWMQKNPLHAVADGFRQYADAFLSLFSGSTKTYNKAERGTTISSGTTTVSNTTSVESGFEASFDLSGILDYNGNNNFTMPDNITTLGTYSEVKNETKVSTTTTTPSGVPVTTSVSRETNDRGETTNKVSSGVGVDNGKVNVQANVSASTTTDSNGNSSSKVTLGVQAEVPYKKDEQGWTHSVGVSSELNIRTQ